MHILNTLRQNGFELRQIKGENLEPIEDFKRFLEELKGGSTLFCEKNVG